MPTIITICGSSKYVDIMAVLGWFLEKDESAIVHNLHRLPWWYETDCSDDIVEHEGVAEQMASLHFKKIELSDAIFVVDWNNYIGESTRNEIQHATECKKTIRYLSCEPEYQDRILDMMKASVERKRGGLTNADQE